MELWRGESNSLRHEPGHQPKTTRYCNYGGTNTGPHKRICRDSQNAALRTPHRLNDIDRCRLLQLENERAQKILDEVFFKTASAEYERPDRELFTLRGRVLRIERCSSLGGARGGLNSSE